MSGISVIICCYNSAGRLPATLRHLAAQACGAVPWEVVVVDNNSSDDTAEVARQQWQQLGAPAPLTVVPEPRPGLSMARDKGLAHARYGLVLFCDDDNWLEADYLREAHELMRQDPAIGVLGGLNTAVADVPLPAWFEQVSYAYACGPQADQDGEVSPQRLYVAGAGMVVRRHLFAELAQVGFESQLLDRKGEELSSGGDSELCLLAALLGHKVAYSSRLRLQHYMPAGRLQWSYLRRLMQGHAHSSYRLEFYKRAYHHAPEPRWATKLGHLLGRYATREGLFELYHYARLRLGHHDVYGLHSEFKLAFLNTHLHAVAEHDSIRRKVGALQQKVAAWVRAAGPETASGRAEYASGNSRS